MDSNIFERASRMKLRFETAKGSLPVEDLWDLPLTSTTKAPGGKPNNLDDLAMALDAQIGNGSTKSFVTKTSTTDAKVQLRFDLVRRIIDVRLEESRVRAERKASADQRDLIARFIEEKKVQGLRDMSLEDLMAKFDTLNRQANEASLADA